MNKIQNKSIENKSICPFGFIEKDGTPHICKVNCECEFATFGICNEDGSYGYGTLRIGAIDETGNHLS